MPLKVECPNCQRLQAELEAVRAKLEEAQARIAALEAELRRGRRQAAPFSRDEPKADPKPPGRRPGQGRFSYRPFPPAEAIQETLVVPLEECPECGGPLQDKAVHEQVQVEIPEVEPEVTRFWTQSGYCPRCRKRVRSRPPQPVSWATGAAGVSIGPRAKAWAADLKHRLGIPYRKIADIFQSVFGLEVSAGGIVFGPMTIGRWRSGLSRSVWPICCGSLASWNTRRVGAPCAVHGRWRRCRARPAALICANTKAPKSIAFLSGIQKQGIGRFPIHLGCHFLRAMLSSSLANC